MWIQDGRVSVIVKVDKESMLAKLNEVEKQMEHLRLAIADMKKYVGVIEEPADAQAQ